MAERQFKFRAQIVVDLRTRRDEEAQRALQVADAAVERARQAVETARARLQDACTRPRENVAQAEWYRNWMIGLRAAIARAEEAVAVRRRERDEALAQALRARRDLRVIQRLRERRLKAFNLDAGRREQRQIDELATRRHERASMDGSGGTS